MCLCLQLLSLKLNPSSSLKPAWRKISSPLAPSPHLAAHPGAEPLLLLTWTTQEAPPWTLHLHSAHLSHSPQRNQVSCFKSNQVVPWPQDFHGPPSHCHHIRPQRTCGSVPSFPDSAMPLSPACSAPFTPAFLGPLPRRRVT